MTRRLMVVAVLAMLALGATTVTAHDDYRIIGTVEKVTAKTLDVKQTKDGKIISMQMNGETIVTRDKKKVDRAELKTGLNVVVDARGDSLKDLQVLEVRLVPKPSGK
jgi:hypothetical protein